VGIQLPRVIYSTTLPTTSFNTPYQGQPIEEKSNLEKSLEAFFESGQQIQNMKDSQSHQNF